MTSLIMTLLIMTLLIMALLIMALLRMTLLIMTLLIMTTHIMTILIKLNTSDITNIGIIYYWFYLSMTLLITVNKKYQSIVTLINVTSEVFISIVVVSWQALAYFDMKLIMFEKTFYSLSPTCDPLVNRDNRIITNLF